MRFRPDIPYDVPPLPPKVDLSRTAFAEELLPARVALAELKGYSELLPNPLILLSMPILGAVGAFIFNNALGDRVPPSITDSFPLEYSPARLFRLLFLAFAKSLSHQFAKC